MIDLVRLERLRKKRWEKTLKRKRKIYLSLKKVCLQKRPWKRRRYRKSIAPEQFSFVDNTNDMLVFFETVEKNLDEKKPVNIDISHIITLTPDGIATLCAYIKKDKSGYIKGNAPIDKDLQSRFIASGFYDYVHSFWTPPRGPENKLHHNRSLKKVDCNIAKEATLFAMSNNLDKDVKRSLYVILIELMANTNNHADLQSEGLCDWWLYYYYDKNIKKTCFVFLDFGVGIFKSRNFKKYLGLMDKTTEEMANDLLEGKIASRTGLACRGKGFSCIIENADKTFFSKFIVVANNAWIDIKSKQVKKLEKEFKGTFYYWEL